MKIKDVIKHSSLPQLEVEILLAFILNTTREYIASHLDSELEQVDTKKYKRLEQKRLNNFPIAYLIGEKDFYNLTFQVNDSVLVPRPETEIIIDYIKNEIIKKNVSNKSYTFLDIGTGSGSIIVTLTKLLQDNFKNTFSKSTFLAVDISSQALKVARANAKKYYLDRVIEFKKSNLISQLTRKVLSEKELIICANLPYLTKKEMEEVSIKREPKLALYGRKDGLKYYQDLFHMLVIKKIINFTLICEINPQQITKIRSLAGKYFGVSELKIETLKDYSKQDRFIVFKSKSIS